eukprot:scaffold8444_cov258-Pinguiococcus_pyrenoidosus.AAC.3
MRDQARCHGRQRPWYRETESYRKGISSRSDSKRIVWFASPRWENHVWVEERPLTLMRHPEFSFVSTRRIGGAGEECCKPLSFPEEKV